MSDSAQQPQQQQSRPRRPLWRRLLRWLFIGGAVLVLLVLVTLGGGVWYASHNRVRLANRALENVGPFRGQIQAVQLDRHGNFDVRGLEFVDKASGRTVLRLPKVTGKFEWGALRSSNAVESLVFENPEIHLDELTLKSFTSAANTSGTEANEGAKGFAGLRIDHLQLKDATVSFTDKDGTRHEVEMDYLADRLRLDEQGLLHSGEQQLTISHEDLDVEHAPYGVRLLEAKGRIKDGIVDLDEVNVQQPVLHATPQVLAQFGIDVRNGTVAPKITPTAVPAPLSQPGFIRGIRVGKLAVKDLSVSAKGFAAGNPTGVSLPDAGIVIPRYEADEMSWKPGEPLQAGAQRLLFQDLKIASETDDGVLNIRELSVALNPKEDGQPWTIRYLRVEDPSIHWTRGLHQVLQAKAAAFGAGKAPTPSEPTDSGPSIAPSISAGAEAAPNIVRIMKGGITGATVKISDKNLMPFDLTAKAGLMLTEIEFGAQGWKSQSFQSLEVTEGKLQFPTQQGGPEFAPFFELPTGELVVKPDEWNANRKVARLTLEKPVVRLREGNTPWIPHHYSLEGPPYPVPAPSSKKEPASDAASPAVVETQPAASPKPEEEQPWWKRMHYGQLTVNDGFADLVLLLPRPVDMQARVNITTERTTTGGSRHHVRIADFAGKLPTLSKLPFPVLQAGVLEGSVLLPEMWSQRRIEEMKLTGANVEVGEALMKLFEPAEKPNQEAAASATATAPAERPAATASLPDEPWRVGHLQVTQSSVSLQHLVPGLESVHFGVEFEVNESPLLLQDILKDATPQRVDLANIRIPSVQDPLRSVAELQKIGISLSLQGLARKEIDHIEIMSPTLYVGEDLFWYVDYYRKYMAGGTRASPDGPRIAAVDDDFEFEVSSTVIESEPPLSEAAWSIKRLQVHDGKLIVAPKGKPLFKTPFPFRVDTQVTRGTLQADLDIPSDDYPIPQLDLKLVGMSGRVQFNLPFKQKDNNLTETFEVDSIQYEDFKTGKAYLTVTYDKAGIYAKFGAEAYEGYLNGEANVYLTDSYHWDGWITGKDVQTKHLSELLTPTYFFMEGKVETSLVAQGSMLELYQGDASFKNLTPGKINIKALDDVIKDLPKEWDPLRQQITKIGLETLRDFDYDRAEMKARFYGREGNGYIRFKGPQGSRNFDINVYDHRWTDDTAAKNPSP